MRSPLARRGARLQPRSVCVCGLALALVALGVLYRGGTGVSPVHGQDASGGTGVSPVHGPSGGTGVSPVHGQDALYRGGTGVSPVQGQDACPGKAGAADENPLAGCTMCHIDVEDEFVGGVHFAEKVGCKKCHGPSEGHVADENNEVKPDELFARKDVDRLCGKCHECPRPKEPKPAPAEPRKVCTECHGAHEFPVAAEGEPCRVGFPTCL